MSECPHEYHAAATLFSFLFWPCLYNSLFPFLPTDYALVYNGRVLYSCALVVAVFFILSFERASERVFHFLGRSFSLFIFVLAVAAAACRYIIPWHLPLLSLLGVDWFSLFPGALDFFLVSICVVIVLWSTPINLLLVYFGLHTYVSF